MSNSTLENNARPTFRRERTAITFRVYYDAASGRCTHKTLEQETTDQPYILVDHKTYNEIDICDKFKVADGKLERTVKPVQNKRLSQVTVGRFKTVKNNMMFIVGNDFVGETDSWDYYKDEQ
jgi:hypothetical protein